MIHNQVVSQNVRSVVTEAVQGVAGECGKSTVLRKQARHKGSSV